VGNFTTVSAASAVFTTATITTVNTTTLDLTNLEVTNIKAKDGTASMVIDDATGKVNVTTVSAASMNAGVAAVTTLTATGASVASANLGVAVVTNLTATGASVASMNAGVALLTNATITTLNATGASIASANIGNLQFTAASIASINAGVAVITNLTATSASIASMNAGVALLTTATVTGLTATGASIASANAGNLQVTGASVASANVGVALITTGTVTALTATGASIASANVGTAVITGLTVTNASIASANAGTATLSGNLTLSGGTANGVLYLNGSKVATSGSALTFDGTNFSSTGTTTVNSGNSSSVGLVVKGETGNGIRQNFIGQASSGQYNWQIGASIVAAGAFSIIPSTAADGSTFTTAALVATGTGNIGIGTASPSYKLDVFDSGGTSIAVGAGTGKAFLYGDNTGITLGSISNIPIRFSPNSSEGMRLTSTGLGIGTSSPANKLDVKGTAGNGISLTHSNNTVVAEIFELSGVQGAGLELKTSSGTSNVFFNAGGESYINGGNLGIGTSSPSARLSVSSGNIFVDNANGSVIVRNADATNQQQIRLRMSGTDGVLDTTRAAGTATNLIFGTEGVERMRLDSSGNLGLGVTPSAWSTSYYKVIEGGDSGNQGAVGFRTDANGVELFANAYFNGTNNIYKFTGAAGLYQNTGGTHAWLVAPSGTAGNTISFTQALTLNANGALILQGGDTGANGIGVTFPASQSASSNANTLDDYEEGTWTPTITGSTSNPSVTYSNQEGFYCKIGRTVVASGRFVTSAWSGGSGDLRVSLPFTANSTSGFRSSGSCSYILSITNGGSAFVPQVSENTAYMTFYKYTDADEFVSSVLANDNTSGTTQVNFCVTYQV